MIVTLKKVFFYRFDDSYILNEISFEEKIKKYFREIDSENIYVQYIMN